MDPRLTGYDTSAFKTGNDDLLVVFLNRKSYVDYTVGRSFTGAVKRALSYPVTLTFQNAKEGVIKQDKLNYQSIQYEYDEAAGFWAVNQDYLLPQPAGEQVSKPGYNTFWTVDDKKLTDSGKINITSDNPTVEIDYVIQNPTIQPVADGTVQADFHTLSIDLDAAGPHTVGVQVSHPLLKEQQGTEDTYVYFQYCWWDESGEESGVNGPRSRAEPELFSSSAENGILNRVKTGNAVIPIDGQEHARTDGHYYMVEIYGYLVENGGTPELFYKSHHNFIDFGSDSDTEATVSRSYTLQVEVTQVERHAVLFQTGEHGTLEGTSNFAVKDGSTMRKSGYPVPSVAADSGYSFTGWLGTDGITRTSNEVLDLTVTGDMTFTAQYAKDSGSGGSTGTTRYTIEASAGHGGGISPDGRVRVSRGSDKTFRITPDAGYEIADVLVDGESVGAVSRYTFETVRKNHTIEAEFRAVEKAPDTGVDRWLNTTDHMAYLNGYGTGLFGPDDHMTRAEAAQMFYNLLLDQEVSSHGPLHRRARRRLVRPRGGDPGLPGHGGRRRRREIRPGAHHHPGGVHGDGHALCPPARGRGESLLRCDLLRLVLRPGGGGGAVRVDHRLHRRHLPSGGHHHPGGGDGHYQPPAGPGGGRGLRGRPRRRAAPVPRCERLLLGPTTTLWRPPTPTATVSMTARSTGCKREMARPPEPIGSGGLIQPAWIAS